MSKQPLCLTIYLYATSARIHPHTDTVAPAPKYVHPGTEESIVTKPMKYDVYSKSILFTQQLHNEQDASKYYF